jgi:transcriptional regulator of acetoin/glycerol metabolism
VCHQLDDRYVQDLLARAEAVGPKFKQLLLAILSPHAKLNYRRALALLNFARQYPVELLEAAADVAIPQGLKLSGILDTLDMRLLESQQNQLDYKSFLSLVLQDEIEVRQMRKVKRLLRRARFGHEQTLESFDFSLAPTRNATLVRELATRRFLERGEGVILTGPPGTGKTHLAKALGHAACRHLHAVFFTKFHRLFVDLMQADLVGQRDKLIKFNSKVNPYAKNWHKKTSRNTCNFDENLLNSNSSFTPGAA